MKIHLGKYGVYVALVDQKLRRHRYLFCVATLTFHSKMPTLVPLKSLSSASLEISFALVVQLSFRQPPFVETC